MTEPLADSALLAKAVKERVSIHYLKGPDTDTFHRILDGSGAQRRLPGPQANRLFIAHLSGRSESLEF